MSAVMFSIMENVAAAFDFEGVYMAKLTAKEEKIFKERMEQRDAELRWLYMELYNNSSMYGELVQRIHEFYVDRRKGLKKLDESREKTPDWYKGGDQLGMMLYIDNFAGNLRGVMDKLDYLEDANVNYIHLMPFLDTVKERSDGGYAVKDFRKVRPDLGTMKDLSELTKECHSRNMNVCCDFVMNHTSVDHEWAVKAKTGDGEYMSRYFFFDRYDIPQRFEETVPEVFPSTAPGNFTFVPEVNHYVMTSFHSYQWDLNYRNPRVFNEMMYNFLFLANEGLDVIRIDAVPYIWKTLGTSCRNLPEVHTIVRIMRIIGEIVCPGVLLLGEVVMEPSKVVPYFGTVAKPECHMLYNVTTMATTWHTVATRDVRLLKKQLDIVNALPKEYTFLNYLRCHDDIGWGLDYDTLRQYGMEEVPHKTYLNKFFLGSTGMSCSRGELYNYDPVTKDARFCGTTASLSGIEKAGYEKDDVAMDRAIRLDVMLHAYMFMQSGIPIIYSGDEIGQVNDYSYKDDPDKADDSRYLHRGRFHWENAEKRKVEGTVEERIFDGIKKLSGLRKKIAAFSSLADTWTIDTGDDAVLAIGRYMDGEKVIGIFNFSEAEHTAWINEDDGIYDDLMTGEKAEAVNVKLEGYGFKMFYKFF